MLENSLPSGSGKSWPDVCISLSVTHHCHNTQLCLHRLQFTSYFICQSVSVFLILTICAFSTLAMLAERQEGHSGCKRVVGCWHGYLSGVRCRLAYSPADATTTSCFIKIQIDFTFPVLAHTGSPGQREVKWVCVIVTILSSNFFLQLQQRIWLSNSISTHNVTYCTSAASVLLSLFNEPTLPNNPGHDSFSDENSY